jgi:DNA-binding CsgD family transcriptional regulator
MHIMPNRHRTEMVMKKALTPALVCRYRAIIFLMMKTVMKRYNIHGLIISGKSLYQRNIYGTVRYAENTFGFPTDLRTKVLKLIAEGYTHKEAADILNISTKMVVTHETNISEKPNLHTRAGRIKFAIQKGIIKIDTQSRGNGRLRVVPGVKSSRRPFLASLCLP